ncbi:E3 ubiquitin-protein ligase UBR1 [Thelohanellus kitauei]|uniref:E3 ubiquitin-protein ligase n=1 Tax=Thelohanellus kitauei TaxID=669202 RepID=A0A0C2MLN1_THEKT|nr:E3 ubiquitin-protein ligase UBR1 [Thelohanellus kitauei]
MTFEEIKDKIDEIIINGLLLTSSDKRNSPTLIYEKNSLKTLIGVPLEQYLFEALGPDAKQWFDSDDGKLPKCTKIIFKDDLNNRCIDCERHNGCCICEDCFLQSEHVNHSYIPLELSFGMNTCDCGELESWEQQSTCSLHQKTERSEIQAPREFLSKLSCIVKYFCELLEKICIQNHTVLDKEIERMIAWYIQNQGAKMVKTFVDGQKCMDWMESAVKNANKLCLLIQDEGVHDRRNYSECWEIAEDISREHSGDLNLEMHDNGYVCVIYRSGLDECQNAKELIDKSAFMIAKGVPVKSCIVKVSRLYFMKTATILTGLINSFCLKKTQLGDVLSEIIFKQTSLADTYVLNEHTLWRNLILNMTSRVLLPATYSDRGKAYFAHLYLQHIELLYNVYLRGYYEKYVGFLFIFTRLVKFSSVVMYLVEEGFLCKVLDLFSCSLKTLGLGVGADVGQHAKRLNEAKGELMTVLRARHVLLECFKFSLERVEWSSKFRSQISEAGRKIVEFCFDFDDIHPMSMVYQDEQDAKSCEYLNLLIKALYGVVCAAMKWIIFFDEVTIETLKLFVQRFVVDIKRISDDDPCIPIKQKIVTYCNIMKDKFSILNLSHRAFADILMHCCVNGILPHEIRDEVLGDETMLMWIGRPMITSLSSITSNIYIEWDEKSANKGLHFQLYFNGFCHYLYLQDFNLLQILICNLDPELFLKYFLFNCFPHLREKADFSQPLSSILCVKEINTSFTIHKLLCFIYNALLERHFVGLYDNPEYQLIERQVIHFLALDDQTEADIESDILLYREMILSIAARWINGLRQALKKVSSPKENFIQNREYRLNPSYYNIINIFYFMYENA